jgi:Zinc-finger associated domain (zf-AD)
MSLAICRCCLNKDINENKLINMTETFLFDENQPINENILINFAYFNFSGIDLMFTESDLKICISCRTLLQTSYNFRELCRESHEVLVNSQIKTGK